MPAGDDSRAQSPATHGASPGTEARSIDWTWPDALVGAVFALPAAAAMAADVSTGLSLAVGVLPAAISGLPPSRRARVRTAALGLFVGLPIVLGSLLSEIPLVAVIAMFAAGVGAVALARRVRIGVLAMTLGLPMVGIGFSYPDVGEAAGLAVLMIAGSIYAAAVSMLWPEYHPLPTVPAAHTPAIEPEYGVLLGATGAVTAALGFALELDHVGWACAAALLVMRPAAEIQRIRSVGRLASVTIGAASAILWLRTDPATAGFSVAVIVILAGASATRHSRWYISSGFTTFLVFVMLLHDSPNDAHDRFLERVTETALGVCIAYVFGLVVPKLRAQKRS